MKKNPLRQNRKHAEHEYLTRLLFRTTNGEKHVLNISTETTFSSRKSYLKTRFNRIKIRESLNRYNSEDNNFRSTNEGSLEARNLPL